MQSGAPWRSGIFEHPFAALHPLFIQVEAMKQGKTYKKRIHVSFFLLPKESQQLNGATN
jgi:hypothetical protein